MSTQPQPRLEEPHRSEYTPMSPLAIAQREGEDAHITGTTRSLHRRTLGLNVSGSLPSQREALRPSTHQVLPFPSTRP